MYHWAYFYTLDSLISVRQVSTIGQPAVAADPNDVAEDAHVAEADWVKAKQFDTWTTGDDISDVRCALLDLAKHMRPSVVSLARKLSLDTKNSGEFSWFFV